MEKKFLVKIHKSYREVVAVCDVEIFGRKLEEGNKSLDLSGPFFEGEALDEDIAKRAIIEADKEDATFNVVGKNSINLFKNLGLVKDEGVMEIEGVPFALVLL